jgi:hypothetical protein
MRRKFVCAFGGDDRGRMAGCGWLEGGAERRNAMSREKSCLYFLPGAMLRCVIFSLLLLVWAVSECAWAGGGSEVGNGQYTRLGSVSSERLALPSFLAAPSEGQHERQPSISDLRVATSYTHEASSWPSCLQCDANRATSSFCMSGRCCCPRCTMHTHVVYP